MRLDLLLHHCADLGIDVEYDDLGTRHGVYYDDRKLIVLNQRCTRAQMTGALSHEVAHAIYADRCSTPEVEKRADRIGAALIITPDEYADAETQVGEHAGALARHLGVTRRVILAWRDWYHRHPFDLAASERRG